MTIFFLVIQNYGISLANQIYITLIALCYIYSCRPKTEEMVIKICTNKLGVAGLVVGETL